MSDIVIDAVNRGIDELSKAVDKRFATHDQAITELAQKMDKAPASSMRGFNGDTLPEIASDAQVKSFIADRGMKSVSIKLDLTMPALIKAVTGDTGAEVYDVPAQRSPVLANFNARRLSVFDVLPRLAVQSNTFEFNALNSYVNAAAYQATEGSGKAAGTMPTALKSSPICTIAHYFKLSEQVLADSPALQQQVRNLLAYGVLAKASSEILAGAAAGKIQGLATVATAFASTAGATLADGIGEAMVALDVAGWHPDVVVMNPSDWFAIRSERTADAAYVGGGWSGPTEQPLWGMRVVTDPTIAAGSPLVLDSSQTAILDRMQTRVELGRSGDDMTSNLLTALGECRIGLAVFAPSAVRKVSLTT